MKILFLTLVDISKEVEPGNIYGDLVEALSEKGHEIVVLTPLERRMKGTTKYINEGKIRYLQVLTPNITKSNFFEKTIGLLSLNFLIMRAVKKYIGDGNFDLILYSTPPITISKTIKHIKKITDAKTYLLLKDIFPQNAVDLKMFKNHGLIHRYFMKTEKELYQISDRIGCMSNNNLSFMRRNFPEFDHKLEVNPNTVSIRDLQKLPKADRKWLMEQYGIPVDKVLYLYGGNLGKPQGVDFILKILKANEESSNNFILIVGSGTEAKKITDFINNNALKNSLHISSLPRVEYEKVLASSDVGMIFLDYRFTIPNYPSRLLSYMQFGKPIIAATDPNTDIKELLEENQIGFWTLSDNVHDFINNQERMLDKELRIQMGNNSYEYLNNNFDVTRTATLIEKSIKE